MPVKATFMFNMATVPNDTSPRVRVADWTEGYICSADDIPAAKLFVRNGAGVGARGLLFVRAAILPAAARIVDVQLQKWTAFPTGEQPVGGLDELGISVPGNTKLTLQDAPQVALACNLGFNPPHRKRVVHHVCALPDNMVSSGEAKFTGAFRANVEDFFKELGEGYGTFIDDRTGGPEFVGQPLLGMTVEKVAVGVAPVLFAAVGDLVKVKGTTDAGGRRRSGVFRVTALAAGVPVLGDWPYGSTEGGTIFKWRRLYVGYKRDVAPGGPIGGLVVPTPFYKVNPRKVGSKKSYSGRNRRRSV